ncbi:MAG: hypothetical protein MK101_03390 [Phycisphaerales bacterium]|nr:hypothetical protein [Phycisphaerales bacterium]
MALLSTIIVASLAVPAPGPDRPNILVIIWDDIGIDQTSAFGWTHA